MLAGEGDSLMNAVFRLILVLERLHKGFGGSWGKTEIFCQRQTPNVGGLSDKSAPFFVRNVA